jgi:hypothetical protein
MSLKLFGRIVVIETFLNIIATVVGITVVFLLLWVDWRSPGPLFGRIVMTDKHLNIIALMVGIAGIILLLWVDWRVALGIVLFAWGNNRSILLMAREEVQEHIHLLRTGGMRPKDDHPKLSERIPPKPPEPVDRPNPGPRPTRALRSVEERHDTPR